MAVLRARTPITLTKPMDLPKAKRVTRREGDIACDEILFERLRTLRKQLADERHVPAYIIFGDTRSGRCALLSDEHRATRRHSRHRRKERAEFGEIVTSEIANYLTTNSRMAFE